MGNEGNVHCFKLYYGKQDVLWEIKKEAERDDFKMKKNWREFFDDDVVWVCEHACTMAGGCCCSCCDRMAFYSLVIRSNEYSEKSVWVWTWMSYIKFNTWTVRGLNERMDKRREEREKDTEMLLLRRNHLIVIIIIFISRWRWKLWWEGWSALLCLSSVHAYRAVYLCFKTTLCYFLIDGIFEKGLNDFLLNFQKWDFITIRNAYIINYHIFWAFDS